MKSFLFIFSILFILQSHLFAKNTKSINEISKEIESSIALMLYKFEHENLSYILNYIMKKNEEIMAIEVIDNTSNSNIISIYHDENDLIKYGQIPSSIILNSEVVNTSSKYKDQTVGNIVIYFLQHKKSLKLTKYEKYLLSIYNKEITMCVHPNWMPYEKIKENKTKIKGMNDYKHLGIVSEYMKLVEDTLGIKITLIASKSWSESLKFVKSQKCNILSLAVNTPEKNKYLNFTTPYMSLPLAIATKQDVPFIDNINQIKDKTIVVKKNYAFKHILKSKYPNLTLIEVNNQSEGLLLVKKEKVFGMVDALASLSYAIQKEYTHNLKIAGKFDEQINLSIALHKDQKTLLTILNKTIKSIEEKDIQKIVDNWISVKYEKAIDFTLIYKILFLVLIILSIMIYRQLLLKKLNKQLKSKIQEELEKNIQKEKILLEQNKHAAMGEMIANIAHQWRQPLTELS
jgi:ABC-type amino acid transport substrate-binding protein